MRRKYLVSVGLAVLFAATAVGLPRAFQQEPVDLDGINKIKAIGLDTNSSKVMEIASYLTDVYGPRLTGSPNIKKAGDWSVATMKSWGLENVALEPWPADGSGQNGGFPCGWSNDKFYLAAVTPQAFAIPGTPPAWSPGTNGLVRGEVVMVAENTKEAIEAKYPAGKLKGKWVITAVEPTVPAYFTAPGMRYTTEQLDRMENPPPPDPNAPARGGGRGARAGAPPAGAPPAGAPPAAAAAAPAAGRAAAPPTPAPPPPPPPKRTDVCMGKTPDPAWVKAQADAQAAAAAAAAAAPPVDPAAAAAAQGRGGNRGGGGPGGQGGFNRNAYFKEQGVLGVFTTAPRGHGIYTIGGASRNADPATQLSSITIPAEEYGRLARMIGKGVPVIVEGDIKSSYQPNPPMFNVVGEIRGTDKADEVVMLGAHFDSWHASTGATDNAAGSAAMLEAMRILKTSGVKLRRTVRIGLWTGEEQGLIGSARYVATHFGGGRGGGRGGGAPAPPTPEHAKFSGYFNIDNGTGAIRGVYLQSNPAVGPIFKAWMAPFNSLGMTHITAGNTGGTDHGSFDNVGLPGWQFIQDEIEYNAMTHHTNLDSFERLQAEDMRKNATIAAAFAFLAANRDQLLPRKPPAAAGGRGGQ
jgi:hypothetical protein